MVNALIASAAPHFIVARSYVPPRFAARSAAQDLARYTSNGGERNGSCMVARGTGGPNRQVSETSMKRSAKGNAIYAEIGVWREPDG